LNIQQAFAVLEHPYTKLPELAEQNWLKFFIFQCPSSNNKYV